MIVKDNINVNMNIVELSNKVDYMTNDEIVLYFKILNVKYGVTKVHLAKVCGISRQIITQIFNDDLSHISENRLREIAQYYIY